MSDFNIAIKFRMFSLWLVKISISACFKFIFGLMLFSFENFGTNLNILKAHKIPSIAKNGILLSPKYCAIVEDNNGPIENPRVPQAIKIPIFLAVSEVENFEINPKACG